MTKKEAITYYESLPYIERRNLQIEFGNEGIADRETKFYKWLAKKLS